MSVPKIGLIGVGHFGNAHLEEWLKLQSENKVEIAALVVRTERSKKTLAAKTNIPVYTTIDKDLLAGLDAVDIVTPAETHLTLIEQCLPHCYVLVEKPMVNSTEELTTLNALLDRHQNKLMVGHNYRFLPAIQKLREIVKQREELPSLVEITMLNESAATVNLNPNLEYIHAFDLMDYLFELEPSIETSRNNGNSHEISIRYGDSIHCVMNLGWYNKPSKRSLQLLYPEVKISCDLFRNSIRVNDNNRLDTYNFTHEKTSLHDEMQAFLEFLCHGSANPMPPDLAARSLLTALRTTPGKRVKRPRVAVIGGGVFGASCALELNHFCDVTLFERHRNLMEEVSFVNQWRHHSGFHYPRSYDTIKEIRTTKHDFEALYGDAVRHDYVSYFCPSATGIEIPAERYLAACSNNYLSFSFEYPPADIVDRDTISISLKTDEGVYDYYKLRTIIQDSLTQARNIKLLMGTNVVNARILSDGIKRLTFDRENQIETGDYDYLINASYANRNLLAKWFSFPVEPLRFDLYELLILRLPIPYVCVTIIDGPFTSLVGMGYDNLFMLSHIQDSVLKSDIPADGMPPDWGAIQSNRHNMLLSASKYMPILKQAEIVESRFATRVVNAYAHDFDARPSVITNHGFGCWSVMGGKIITCVTNAREIAGYIKKNISYE